MKKIILIGMFFMLMLMTVACSSNDEGVQVDDYRIQSAQGVYSGQTRSGHVDLEIETIGGSSKQMFTSSDDITKNGRNQIVDDAYLLRIFWGEQELDCAAYEEESLHDQQKVRIYFTNDTKETDLEKLRVVIAKGTEDQIAEELEPEMETLSDHIEYTSIDGHTKVYLSEEGMYLKASTPSYMTLFLESAGSLQLCAPDQTWTLALTTSVDLEQERREDLLVPVVISQEKGEDENGIWMALPIESWKDIETIEKGGSNTNPYWFVRSDLGEDLDYQEGVVSYAEEGVLILSPVDSENENAIYHVILPEEYKDHTFQGGSFVYVVYEEKTEQDYGYELSGVKKIIENG